VNKFSDEHIMRKVKKGNLKRIWTLYDLYYIQLYNYFYLLTLNQIFSEDLVVEVFKQIIQFRSTYNKKIRYKPWMFSIARNVYLNNKDKIASQSGSSDKMTDNEIEDSVNQIADKKMNESLIINAMHDMADSMKELLLLSRFLNYDFELLAQVYHTTENDIRKKVHRVTDEFRKIYVGTLK
jgi:RNA polymerase sigma-70 factor (ECF subfamily)